MKKRKIKRSKKYPWIFTNKQTLHITETRNESKKRKYILQQQIEIELRMNNNM